MDGVYILHAGEGDLPLYIGKSVNLRSRLLAHLRNPDEARLLHQTLRIIHIRTAGEVSALLLEASFIKQQHLLLSQKLRRNRNPTCMAYPLVATSLIGYFLRYYDTSDR